MLKEGEAIFRFNQQDIDNSKNALSLVNSVQEILNENHQCEMYFILDDEVPCLRKMVSSLQTGFDSSSPKLKKTASITFYEDSQSLFKNFSEFNLNGNNLNKSNNVNKFIIVDGLLSNDYKKDLDIRYGDMFIYKLISECKKNNWDIPYVIGCSGDSERNQSVRSHLNLSLNDLSYDYRTWEYNLREKNNFNINSTGYLTAIEERQKITTQDCPYYLGSATYKDLEPIVAEIQKVVK